MPSVTLNEEETIHEVRNIVERIGSTRADLIAVLQAITNQFGVISQTTMQELSTLMSLPTKEIGGNFLPNAFNTGARKACRSIL